MIESRVNPRCIQRLLEHISGNTTEIYMHVSKASITKIEAPLDRLIEEKRI